MLSSCVCLSVRLSVSLSQAGTVPKWLNTGSHKQQHRIDFGIRKLESMGGIVWRRLRDYANDAIGNLKYRLESDRQINVHTREQIQTCAW